MSHGEHGRQNLTFCNCPALHEGGKEDRCLVRMLMELICRVAPPSFRIGKERILECCDSRVGLATVWPSLTRL